MNTIISCSEENVGGRDWSSLNCDLKEHIFKKLPTISDLISCSIVCRSWCSACHNHIISNLPVKSPVLLLLKEHLPKHLSETSSSSYFFQLDPDKRYCFFNPETYELYRLSEKSKELLEWKNFIGSSKGWAIFADVTNVIMFNAPTGIAIRCPVSPPYGEIKRATLVGDHGTTVAMSNSMFYGLYCAQLGDCRNRPITRINYPCDILCFDGLLYAVFNKGFIQAWDFNQISEECSRSSTKVVQEHSYHPSFNQGKELTPNHQLHLVDSSREIWLLSKLGFGMQSQIGVYKMDFKEKKWLDMESLGDRAVFLSKCQSLCFLPLEPSEYKKNCVYFEDRDKETASRSHRRCIYVYSLEDGSVSKAFYEEELVSPVFVTYD